MQFWSLLNDDLDKIATIRNMYTFDGAKVNDITVRGYHVFKFMFRTAFDQNWSSFERCMVSGRFHAWIQKFIFVKWNILIITT